MDILNRYFGSLSLNLSIDLNDQCVSGSYLDALSELAIFNDQS